MQRVRDYVRELCATYATWDEVRLMFDGVGSTVADLRTTVSGERSHPTGLKAMRLADVVTCGFVERIRPPDPTGPGMCRAAYVGRSRSRSPPRCFVPRHRRDERSAVVVYALLDRADELGHFVAALGDLRTAGDRYRRATRPRSQAASNLRHARRSRLLRSAARARHRGCEPADPACAARPRRARPSGSPWSSCNARAKRWQGALVLRSVEPPQHCGRSRARWAPRRFKSGRTLCRGAGASARNPSLVPMRRSSRWWSQRTTVRRSLAQTLTAIERQTYPQLSWRSSSSTMLALTCATSSLAPRARLIDQLENRGPAAARIAAWADARGTFATLFDDDDEMFPDHVAALAHALIVSGLDVAYGQMINAFVVPIGNDRWEIESFAGHDALLDHADIQWAGALATTAVMFRRTLLRNVSAPVDETLTAAEDYEFWYRFGRGPRRGLAFPTLRRSTTCAAMVRTARTPARAATSLPTRQSTWKHPLRLAASPRAATRCSARSRKPQRLQANSSRNSLMARCCWVQP